ncbi:6-hydroxymethylpterin diphosphokinase MptE-like protein [Pseudomonadota bacterium]
MSNQVDDPLLEARLNINPYLLALGAIRKRLSWDINPESWRSRSKISAWRNRFEGQKAVIVCNGPSLLKTDFGLLEGVFTFGLNKINLLFDKTPYRPSCIVAVNPFVIEQNADFYNSTDIPLFLDSKGTRWVKARKTIGFLHSAGGVGFAQDCSMSVLQGHTVTFVAMQLAFHMGFSDVVLIGCDHNFAVKGPPNATVVSGGKDESHFDPNYFSGGVKWQLPDLFESEVAYTRAKNMYEARGRRLRNATHKGALEIFERCSLAEFVEG